jgi:uncharacterized protein YbaA (DUF1428 family)
MYVDGFVVPVPKGKLDAYWAVARQARDVWREHGAIDYKECLAEDVKMGEVTSFPRSVQMKEDETVIFSWITYKSRAHRDEVNAKVMADPRMKLDKASTPFDGKRLVYGGFEVIVDG